MNFNDILKAVKQQKESGNVRTMHNQTEIMSGSVGALERHEMKPLKSSVFVIPKELQLPFNPVDPMDSNFNTTHKFVVDSSPSVFIKALKTEMQTNTELHNFYASLLKVTVDEYDVSDAETVTEQDMKLFNAYTIPAHFSANTQKLTTAECGKFGMERLSPIDLDEMNQMIDPDQYLMGRLYLLEREIRNEKISDFFNENDKFNLSTDQKEKLATIKASMKVKYPKKSGVAIFLEFPGKVQSDGEFILDNYDTKNPLNAYLRYYNCNSDELKKLNKKLGKKKIDKNIDFLILRVEYGDGVDQNTTQELALYNSREYSGIEFDSTEDPHTLFDSAEDFDTAVVELFNQGLAGEFEKMAKKSIWKFRPLSDETLCELYLSRLTEIKPYITQEILIQFGDVIESVSLSTKKELDQMASEGTLKISAKNLINDTVQIENIDRSIKELDALDTLDTEASVVEQEIPGAEDLNTILN